MIKLKLSDDRYLNELNELVRPFDAQYPYDINIETEFFINDGEMIVSMVSDAFERFQKIYRFKFNADDELERKRFEKRFLKIAVYRTLSFLTKINLPYGCLTGIRPTKLYTEIESQKEKYDGKSAAEVFSNDYSVNAEKINLVRTIVEVQKTLRNDNESALDLFVFIPFCPTKCAYCSFVSLPVNRQKKLLEPFAECLVKELQFTQALIKSKNYNIRSVYIGGGTPTALPLELLDKILTFCHYDCREFTVEAGRPDTITKETVKLLKKHKVTRISVNPQSFNDKTLALIGRKHTCEDILNAYGLVKNKFDVNMDLIAALPEETFDDFKNSVDKTIEMSPDNVTVHTLYMKKGSALKLAGYDDSNMETAALMTGYAYKKLTENGYRPYYMYRQKYTSGNQENIGYAKPGKESIYNIDIMEEDTSIIANGANAISKKWTKDINLIERNANFKEPLEYVKRFDTVIERQKKFWEFDEN